MMLGPFFVFSGGFDIFRPLLVANVGASWLVREIVGLNFTNLTFPERAGTEWAIRRTSLWMMT